MKTNLFIPKKIHVGYQNREDTYTGKLAYIIYTDDKGKRRKEVSWDNWRDLNIPSQDFDNIPTEGFVLNKKVGDYDSGWNHRHAYCRVYDPRNFEFEITIENLIYILENTSSIKGKGLEGEFVYGWSGKDLILMPVSSPDYKEISKITSKIYNNSCIKAKDLKVGYTYLTKNNEKLVYMGRYNYYDWGWEYELEGKKYQASIKSQLPEGVQTDAWWRDTGAAKQVSGVLKGKYYWFCKEKSQDSISYSDSNGYDYLQLKSIPKNKFIDIINDYIHSDYSKMYDAMEHFYKFSPYDPSKDEFIEFRDFEQFKQMILNDINFSSFISFIDGDPKVFSLEYESSRSNSTQLYSLLVRNKNDSRYKNKYYITDKFGQIEEATNDNFFKYYGKGYRRLKPMDGEFIFNQLKPMYRQKYLSNGHKYEICLDLND